MSNPSFAIQAYRTASRYRSQRDQEADVFRQAIAGLKRVRDNASRIHQIRALADNRRLWMTVTDLMRDPGNTLPDELKASIISVGLSVQREMDQDQPDFDFLIGSTRISPRAWLGSPDPMSGSTSYLTSLFSTSFGTPDPLLSALYGSGNGFAAQNPVTALQSAERNETQDIKVTAAQPDVQRAITQFTQAVNTAKSVTQLLANPAVMKVLLTANGMQNQIGYTALATKALTSDLTNPKSLANVLTDSRWKSMAESFNFAANGLKGIQTPSAIAAITAAYTKATWEAGEDAVAPGLSKALDFKARAASMTSVDKILGDPVIRSVVTTALGIPQQIAFQELRAQEDAISTRLNITKLQDPKFVETFAQRYLIANSGSSSAASAPDLTTLAIQGQGLLA